MVTTMVATMVTTMIFFCVRIDVYNESCIQHMLTDELRSTSEVATYERLNKLPYNTSRENT